ncbi:hypothetical protein N9C56_04295 [Paracoccaceae bacterium]|nr:hypothetical protein [Paracoccaceae bacterium]
MQKHIFSIIVIVVSFFGSLVWAEDKIMLCSGDGNYGSHSSLGIEGYKDATVFVRMRTHLLREPSIHYRIGLGDWKKWCSGGVVEVMENTVICEFKTNKNRMPPSTEKFSTLLEKDLKRMRPELRLFYKKGPWLNYGTPNCKEKPQLCIARKDTISAYHFPWIEKYEKNLVINFSSLSVKMTGKKVISDSAGNSFQDSYSSNQKCQIP